jgi:hypothetical protein
LPAALANLVETYGFAWEELERQLAQLGPANAYGRLSRKAWPCPKLGLTVLTWKGGVSYFALRRGSSVAMQTACLTAQRPSSVSGFKADLFLLHSFTEL